MSRNDTEPTVTDGDQLSAFAALLRSANALSGDDLADPADSFQRFILAATPLAVGDMRERLASLRDALEVVEDWWTIHDLISIVGLTYAEDPYTELLAWLFRTETHPPSAVARQRAFLDLIDPDLAACAKTAAAVFTQVGTDNGVPDMVILVGARAAVVETKTLTDEHGARGGETPQTIAYPPAVRRKFALDDDPLIAFITLHPQTAKNPDAVNLTWTQCALAVAGAIRPADVDAQLRGLLATVITHFVTSGMSEEVLTVFHRLRLKTTWSDGDIAANLLAIRNLIKLTGEER